MNDALSAALVSCKLIDLSKRIEPGKATGPLGMGKRKYETKQFTFPPGEVMTEVWMESHISTHVETPAHFVGARHGREGMDVSELPIESFFGEAVLVDLAECEKGEEVLPPRVEAAGVRPGDIVLFGNAQHESDDRPYLGQAVARHLADLPVKAVGVDDSVYPENPAILLKELDKYYTHDYLLSNDIPLIEALVNLDKLPQARFIFIGLPPAMGGCDSFPIRAVALV